MNVLWGRVVVLGVVLLLVFLLGRATGGGGGDVEALQATIASQELEIDQLEADNRALASQAAEADQQADSPDAPGEDAEEATGAGTTSPPASASSPTASPTPQATGPQEYTVASGDNLGRISTRFYNSTAYVKCLQTANNLDGSNIRTGQTLTIPPKPPEPCT